MNPVWIDIHERKCWSCGNVATHKARFTPWVNCGVCGSQDTRATQKPVPFAPTERQLADACLSYRHDFGLLSDEERSRLMFQAREWFVALQKAGVTK